MSVLDIKKREAVQLIEATDNEKLLEQILDVLRTEKKYLTPEEKFAKIADRYDKTLTRLAQ